MPVYRRPKLERIFYAAAGPADLVAAHQAWKQGSHQETEVSITFSSQIADFCQELGATALFVSVHPRVDTHVDSRFVIKHRPKRPRSGIGYYVEELRYGLELLGRARRFRAQLALLDSGVTFFFWMTLFRLFGIKVVPVLHNALWPDGFRPGRRLIRLLHRLDGLFFRFGATAVIAVSPAVARQVKQLAPKAAKVVEVRAQFDSAYFALIPPAPAFDLNPFRIMFVGRVDRIKGVLDIPEMADWVEQRAPGRIHWTICGRGPDLTALTEKIEAMSLANVVTARGWTSLDDLRTVYGESHAAIVPTRSMFAEGLAMTAAEAILAGRPLITNPIVPAAELVMDAVVLARSDDALDHAACALRLAQSRELYEDKLAACRKYGEQFLNREWGLTERLKQALETAFSIETSS